LSSEKNAPWFMDESFLDTVVSQFLQYFPSGKHISAKILNLNAHQAT